MTSALAIVDTPDALAEARCDFPDGVFATDNPLLAAWMGRDGFSLVNLDAAISQTEAIRLGRTGIALAEALDEALDTPRVAEAFGLLHGHIRLAGGSSRLLSSLLYRATVLMRALASYRPSKVALYSVPTPRWMPSHPINFPRFAHPARFLAEHGFFDDIDWTLRDTPASMPLAVNDTACRDLGRRVALLPASVLLHEMWQRLNLPRFGRRHILMNGNNEMIRETLPWLALRGIQAKTVEGLADVPALPSPDGEKPASIHPLVADAAQTILFGAIARLNLFSTPQIEALVQTLLVHVSAALNQLALAVPRFRALLMEIAGSASGTRLMLSGGLFGGVGAQVYGLCRELGMTVVDFEHGVTTGLSGHSQEKIRFSESSTCDHLMVCSTRAATAFAEVGRGQALKIHAVGAPGHVRRLLRPRLQRRWARRALGLNGSKPVVMHVSTTPFFANMRPGSYVPTETWVCEFNRRLIAEVYQSLDKTVLFKEYPTQRFPFEPSWAEFAGPGTSLAFTKDEDLRYVRAAADVIVTMNPTSTLGWCVGTNVPLVWLDSASVFPLLGDELRERFRQSFLTIDLDCADWPDRLRALLERTLDALRQDWLARAPARQRLYDEAVVGPPGNQGRRSAQMIARLHAASS